MTCLPRTSEHVGKPWQLAAGQGGGRVTTWPQKGQSLTPFLVPQYLCLTESAVYSCLVKMAG